MTSDQKKVLGISGSLRDASFNTAALHAAQELAPAGMRIEVFDLAPIPLYDEDLRQRGNPAPVEELRGLIREADGLLIVTPEYNYSFPGVLKNALDWVSRPPDQPFDGKPIAIMGASRSRLGTARAQYHLRQTFVYLNGLIMNQPELMIAEAHKLFDGEGKLTDEATRERLRRFLAAFDDWIAGVGRMQAPEEDEAPGVPKRQSA